MSDSNQSQPSSENTQMGSMPGAAQIK